MIQMQFPVRTCSNFDSFKKAGENGSNLWKKEGIVINLNWEEAIVFFQIKPILNSNLVTV